MKKWNNPEVVELNISETAVGDGTECDKNSAYICRANGNGPGQCLNCNVNGGKKTLGELKTETTS